MTHLGGIAVVALALTLLPAGANAEDFDPAAERVAVLDAGTFLVVEVHHAKLGDVLRRLASHLNAELFNTDQVDLERVVDGRKSGSLSEVMRWLVPEGGFVLISERPNLGDPHLPKLVRIGFLKPGDATPSGIAGAVIGKPVDPRQVKPEEGAAPPRAGSVAIRDESRPSPEALAAGKPDIPSATKSEIKTVSEQLEALTPPAQLAVDAAAHDPSGKSPPPAFLAPQSDAAQLSLQKQQERTQALAAEQLRALIDAFGSACRGRSGGPC